MNPTVFVIDDDEDMRNALSNLFRSVGHEVKLFGSTAEFLKDAPDDAPGCLVLDVRLPGMSGLDFQNKLSGTNIEIPIVFMTGHGDIPMSVRAMKAGAVDFLPKPFRDQDMLDAVATAIDRDRRRRAVECSIADIKARFVTLSPREKQVMMLVTTGKLNKQVAWELGLSERTIKMHRSAMFKTLGVRSSAEAIRVAVEAGL